MPVKAAKPCPLCGNTEILTVFEKNELKYNDLYPYWLGCRECELGVEKIIYIDDQLTMDMYGSYKDGSFHDWDEEKIFGELLAKWNKRV